MAPKIKCDLCHSKARRFCPAREAMICAACCGSKRGPEMNCQDSCPHYPFTPAGYDLWLRIDETLAPKVLAYVLNYHGKDTFEKVLDQMDCGQTSGEQALTLNAGAATEYLLCVARDKKGQSLAERWEAENWIGLNNDERVMMHYRKYARVTILEIQKVLDYQLMECIDLLEPNLQPFLLIDRSTAARAKRFTQLLTWLTHYPYFSRPGYGGVEVPDFISREYMDIVKKEFQKTARTQPGLSIKDHLSGNFGFYCDLTFELSAAKRKSVLKSMDVHQCAATYDIHDYHAVKEILDNYPDFELDGRDPAEGDDGQTQFYHWLRRGESKRLEKDMPVFFRHENEKDGVGNLGNVELRPGKLVVETFSKQKYAFVKKMARQYFGPHVTLRNEKVVDMAEQMAEREEDDLPEDESRKSTPDIPREVERAVIEQFYRKHYKKFLDESVPMLNGHTPRQAAGSPQLRPQLVGLMKGHLRALDKLNEEKGLDINIDWALEELSLAELK